jgi:hypothetical protein
MVKEETDRQITNNRAYVIRRKVAPGALAGFAPAKHISPDRDLVNLGAELEQLRSYSRTGYTQTQTRWSAEKSRMR